MSEELSPLRKNPKKGLGRGLGSLLGEIDSAATETPQHEVRTQNISQISVKKEEPQKTEDIIPGEKVLKVPIEKVNPNKEQPRKTFDPLKLQELAASIKEKGIILPIIVRKTKDQNFEIIAGERRWRAAQLAGLHEVPIIARETDNTEALELALIENIQRHDLNPLEEAEAYGILLNKYQLTQAQISERVGKDRSTIANLLRLLTLSSEVKLLVKSGDLSLGQAKVLMGIDDPKTQSQLAKKAASLKLSVRALEAQIQKIKTGPSNLESTISPAEAIAIKSLQQELQRITGTKVELHPVGKGCRASFYFYSTPELNQFVEKLRKSTT